MTSAQDFLTEFAKALINADPLSRQNLVAEYAKELEARERDIAIAMFPPSLNEDVYRAEDGTLHWKHAIAKGERVKIPVLIHDSITDAEANSMSEDIKAQKETLKEFLGDV